MHSAAGNGSLMTVALLASVCGFLAVLGLGLLAPSPRARRSSALPRLLGLLVRAGGPAVALRAPRDLDARIDAAGRPGGLGVRELMAAKGAAAAAGAAAGLMLSGSAPGRLGTVMVVIGPAAGFLGPDLWLARLAERRARRVRRELPVLLDLLRVSVEAGLSLPAAMADVGRRGTGPLAREWRALARDTELGVPLGEALERSLRRFPLPEIHAFVAALGRSLRHGAPLADTLAAQARDVRSALRRRVQEDAARAGPKIQLVALLLVPSVLLLVAAGLVAALLGPGRGEVVAEATTLLTLGKSL
jgi:tight adherence protein C